MTATPCYSNSNSKVTITVTLHLSYKMVHVLDFLFGFAGAGTTAAVLIAGFTADAEAAMGAATTSIERSIDVALPGVRDRLHNIHSEVHNV